MRQPAAGQRLGLCWGTVPGAGLLEMARVAAAHELEPLAVTAGQFLELAQRGADLGQLRRELADLGVKVSVVDPLLQALPGAPPAAEVDPPMRRLFEFTADDCWRAAEALEAEVINLTHFLGRPTELAALQDATAAFAEANHRRGFATTLEFIPGTGVPDLAAALAVTSASPHASVMFDTWHFARSGGTLEQLDRLPEGAVGGVQINDWAPPPPGQAYVPMSGRLAPGAGRLPLAEILRRIEARSPGLDVGIEVFSAEFAALGWDEAVRRLAACSRPLLAKG